MNELLPSFAVVIPMFNEQDGVRNCIERVCGELARLENRCALIAVNDGSRDGTAEILAGFATQNPLLIVVTHERNLGYGKALKTGTAQAIQTGFDYVLFMDSDMTNDPVDIAKFADKMGKGYDVIKASRYIPGGGVSGVPVRRRLVSWGGNLLGRILFGLGL